MGVSKKHTHWGMASYRVGGPGIPPPPPLPPQKSEFLIIIINGSSEQNSSIFLFDNVKNFIKASRKLRILNCDSHELTKDLVGDAVAYIYVL